MTLHRFVPNDVVHVTKDLRAKTRFGRGHVIVLKGTRGIVKSKQGFLDTRVDVEFVNGEFLSVPTDLLRVEEKAFSLLP